MLNTTTKKSFVLAALMACTGLTSAQAQMLSSGSNNVSVPEMVTKTPVSREGDNLGDHTATQTLDLNGNFVTGIIMNTTPDSSDAVNVGFLDGRIDDIDIPEPDNLGNHIAEQILNMRGYKILNVANAYGGANGDAVNIWTLQRYLSEIPGPDNLGNHIATRDLFLNGHTIRLGPITSTDPSTGLPLAPSGLVINQTMVSGLDLPINGSDAANKAYVDGIVGSIDMSNVVYTVGDQSINGVKTFVQQIQANGGLNSGNQKIVNLADPTAPQDAVNLRTMETALTNIEQNLVLSQPYTVRPVATGSHSFAAGQNAIVGGGNSVALGTNAVATGNGSVALGFRASSSFFNDVVIGNGARNVGDNGRNVIIGEGSVVNRGAYNIVMGVNAQATSPSTGGGSIVAIGENTTAAGQHAVAMGPGANASVNRALAIGSIARASSNEAVAIGRLSTSSANNAIALGHEAQATATNAVAVGRLSVANIADTVSVGNDTIKRRILNVGDPSLDTDAVNLRTLRTEISAYSRYSAGDGILFGTPVAGITPINVDTSVVRTVGTQVIGGNKTFTSSVVVDSDANSGFGMRTAAGVIKSTIFSNSDSLRLVRYAPDGTTIGAQLAILADGRIMPANGRFDGAGQTITSVADPVNPTDAVNLRTLQNAISTGGDNLGNHIATTILNMSNNRIINVAAPINGGDAVNKTYVDNLISGAAYTAGSGIAINAANVISVDTTVVRTTGNQSIAGLKTFTTAIEIINSAVQPGLRVTRTGVPYNSSMSFTTDAGTLYAGQGEAGTFALSNNQDMRYATNGVFEVAMATGDVRWKGTATGILNAANARVQMVADPTAPQDAVNLRTLQAAVSAGGDNLGNHIATTTLNLSGNRIINVAAPIAGTDAVNKTYVDNLYSAGTGLSLAGNQFSFDQTWGDNRYAEQRMLNTTTETYDDLTGGVSGSSTMTFEHAQAGRPTDSPLVSQASGIRLGNTWGRAYLLFPNSQNRVFYRSGTRTAWSEMVTTENIQNFIDTYGRTYLAGSGLSLTGSTFAVDTTVVRTTGNQTIAGTKTFTSPIVVTNTFDVNGSAANAQQNGFYVADLGTTVGTTMNPVQTVGIMAQTNAARSIGVTVDASGYLYGFRSHSTAGTYTWQSRTRFSDRLTTARTINGVSFDGSANITIPDNNTTYSAGSGLSLSGTTFAVDATVVRTTGNQDIAGLKTFTNGDIVLASNSNNNMYMRTGAGLNRFLLYAHGTNGNTYLRNYDTDGTTIASELALTGGGLIMPSVGNLDGNNRVITRVANPVNQTDAVNLRSLNSAYTGGSGINVSSQVVSVDSSVVRTSGDQTISGVKTFNGTVNMNGWDTLRLNAGAATLQVGPNQVRTATDTDFGIYAGNRAGNQRIHMYLEALGTVNIGATSYNSPIMYIGIPYQAGITGNSTSGTGQDAGDNGTGTIASISYRDFRIFRKTSISGGLQVFSSRASDVARFDLPMVGYNGLTVTPGTGGEIRFHAPIYAHSYQTFSDERLKDNIETIEADDGLNIIRDLRPAFFTYKEDGRKASGVIAQEIQKTMPWAVLEAKDGMLTVDYTQIIAPLTAAVQNVDARTSELEAQLAAEIQRNDALEARIEKLEALMSQEP